MYTFKSELFDLVVSLEMEDIETICGGVVTECAKMFWKRAMKTYHLRKPNWYHETTELMKETKSMTENAQFHQYVDGLLRKLEVCKM